MMTAKRLMSLDVLRGLTIALMIMVNNPGSWSYVYSPLRHSKWHGCTPTDLIFPFFLFIVGVSMWYSFKKYGEGVTRKALLKVLKRFLVIFLLGLFLNAFPKFNFENLRFFGVLQRISIAYAVGALFCMRFNYKQLLIVCTLILIGYWGILSFWGSGDVYSLTSNAAGKLDLLLFSENHIYKGFGIPFDPEGLLSAIPSVVTVILGYLSGRLINVSENVIEAVKKLIGYGMLITVFGWFWGYVFPINKPLWTSSYVLYAGGLAMLFLALLLWVIDVKGIKKWTKPFIHFGTNPLFIFVFSGIYVRVIIYLVKSTNSEGETETGYEYLYNHLFVPIAGNMNGSLLFAISHIIVFWLLTYILYMNKIFIKI
ncbi:acyltransferase family protein [Lutibacter citreus]|uniref:acyltransferase family protein n=1 Tax=Lutibacter citreus TaxID=2138210 RepID=UPI000DBE56F5|nr:heparan-alpha-glucosaminide N-acetyltransferase domain-containing protein [Lutibacter citreus]